MGLLGTGGVVVITTKLNKIISSLDERLESLKNRHETKMTEAWGQLAAINSLYEWDTIANLVMKTAPLFVLDHYFSSARLKELQQSFGWNDNFNRDSSILFCQSGAINGNPFIMGEKVHFHMGTETYYGSLTITWKEKRTSTDSKGNRQTYWVTQTETLEASVDKPAPKYNRDQFVVYGSEAAPELSFSRAPSDLFDKKGALNKGKLKKEIARLEKETRKLKGFTIMSNKEFDAQFGAVDRDNERQFRLLFTPLAQQTMLRLLRDKEIGFGDNFIFTKTRKINIVEPAHLADIDISADPSIFQNYDLAAARQIFNEYSNSYFRAFFFAFAPLLTIPLYQQHRSDSDIYKDVFANTPSFWEHEAIANFHGCKTFRHPDSITQDILKTTCSNSTGEGTEVTVTAHGFRGVECTDYIRKRGGDGKWHQVPVKWVEYIPVSQSTPLVVKETGGLTMQDFQNETQSSNEWQDFFRQWQTQPDGISFRRSIVSFVPYSK